MPCELGSLGSFHEQKLLLQTAGEDGHHRRPRTLFCELHGEQVEDNSTVFAKRKVGALLGTEDRTFQCVARTWNSDLNSCSPQARSGSAPGGP
jgi:hypothetical protein